MAATLDRLPAIALFALAVGTMGTVGTAASAQQPAEAPPADAAADSKTEALEAYKSGKQHFAEDRFEEALAAFRTSHDKLASPNSHLMIGKCLAELGRMVEAHASLLVTERTAADAGDKYIETLNAARDLLAAVRAKIGVLRFSAVGGIADLPRDASLRVGASQLERAQWGDALAVEPGTIEVVLTTADGESTQRVEVAAGADVTVALVLAGSDAPPPQPSPTIAPEESDDGGVQRPLAYVTTGVGVAGFVLFGAFGGLTMSTFDDLETRCSNGACPTGSQDDIDAGTTYQTIANIGLIVGAVGVAAGITLFVTDPAIIGGDEEATESSSRGPALEFSVGAGALELRGQF